MEPENKTIKWAWIAGGMLILLTAVAGLSIYVTRFASGGHGLSQQQQSALQVVRSNYGFAFTVPDGWHIWEGQSAATTELLSSDTFIAFMTKVITAKEKGAVLTTEDAEKLLSYQKLMDDWGVASSTIIVLTNASVDYEDRDLALAGKYSSTPIDSVEMLKLGQTSILVSSGEVDFNKTATSTEKREEKNIKINGREARLAIGKSYELVDLVIIRIPIVSDKYINGEKVRALGLIRYIRKGDSSAVQDFVDFISALNITQSAQ